jgi:endonuclease/exonuclease/phosphatase family metal-dependent hydrolase
MSYNILHGATTNGSFDLDTIASVIIREDPDLVALQEVDFKTVRAKNYDLATELGLRSKMAPVFGKAMDYDGGEYGDAVLSKYSFASTKRYSLPYTEGNEPRVAVLANIELPSGDTISFIGTHLDHLRDPKDKISQAKELFKLFSDHPHPNILAGDLNADPESEPMRILFQSWRPSDREYAPTIPSNAPRKKIDYILLSKNHSWKIHDTYVICDEVASDHCVYVAIIEILD